jgi:SAM-dependent methyltransferase
MINSFSEYAKYYDQIYSDKNYESESQYISKILKKKNLRILEIGCGSGEHAAQLYKIGYKLTGIDSSSKMISIAKIKNKKIIFLKKDGCYFRSKKKFDAIILLFHVINFFKSQKELKNFFINSSFNLKKNGIIIFDFININAFKKHPPIKKEKVINLKKDQFLIRKTFPTFNNVTKIFTIKFKIMIYQCKSLIKQFLEIHELKIHSEEEFKKSYESYFRLFKVYKWKTFFNLERQDDWHGTLIIKKK